MLDTVQKTCSNCGNSFDSFGALPQQRTCPRCVDTEMAAALHQWRTAELAGLPHLLRTKLEWCGLSSVELDASLERVPRPVKKLLPLEHTRMLLAGDELSVDFEGFGLCGGQGIGKTMCVAALMIRRTATILERAIQTATAPPEGAADVRWHAAANFVWLNWPEHAARLKAKVMESQGSAAVEAFALRGSNAAVLVLDDIGRERLSKAYDEDYSFAILDRMVDARSRARRPTLWTSNLSPDKLASRYGAALASRLFGLATAIEVPKLPDLRLVVA